MWGKCNVVKPLYYIWSDITSLQDTCNKLKMYTQYEP